MRRQTRASSIWRRAAWVAGLGGYGEAQIGLHFNKNPILSCFAVALHWKPTLLPMSFPEPLSQESRGRPGLAQGAMMKCSSPIEVTSSGGYEPRILPG